LRLKGKNEEFQYEKVVSSQDIFLTDTLRFLKIIFLQRSFKKLVIIFPRIKRIQNKFFLIFFEREKKYFSDKKVIEEKICKIFQFLSLKF